MLDMPVFQFNQRMLRPARNPASARPDVANLSPGTYFAGTLLGQVTASANTVQAVTLGSGTAGTYNLAVEFPIGNVQTTAALAYNANAATIQAALAALSNVGSGNVAVTGTGPFAVTLSGPLLGLRPVPVMTVTSAITGGTAPTVAITTAGVTGKQYRAYASGNGDGSGVWKMILAIDCVVDQAGFVSYSSSGNGGYWSERQLTAPVYYGGEFNSADLVGLDATALTQLGRLAEGTLANGLLVF